MSEIKNNKKQLNRNNLHQYNSLPIKVVQFGEGNFLRAFVEYAFHRLNEELDFNTGIAVVQPIENGLVDVLNQQDGLYTLFVNGIKNGKPEQDIELISNIVKGINPYLEYENFLSLAKEEELKFVISNTTEAGINYALGDTAEMRPPSSFPAKLTALLHERFKIFEGDPTKGLVVMPCELINCNSDLLKDVVLKYINDWNLTDSFKEWVLQACSFHNTLVDRIVPGYPKSDIENYKSKIDYKDNLIVTAERFFLWVIEGGDELKKALPFDKIDLDVKIVQDMQPYRTRKVRILNGAHTAMVPFSILYGNTTVQETIEDDFTGSFVSSVIFDEIISTLDMDLEELREFSNDVLDRFRNPFIKHQLADIALNSISKFRVRVLPSLLEFEKNEGKLPKALTYALACLIRFYKGEWQENKLPLNDDSVYIQEFTEIWNLKEYSLITKKVLGNTNFWEVDLNSIPELQKTIAWVLEEIDRVGIEEAYTNFINQ